MGDVLRIGVLVSGGGSNLQAVLDACQSGQIEGKVVFVGSDNPNAYGLERAKKHHIPTFTINYHEIIKETKEARLKDLVPRDFDLDAVLESQEILHKAWDKDKQVQFLCTRAVAEARLLEAMASYPFDLLVLAGFMRVLTPYFIDRVNADPLKPRIMNIHPALLPAFPGVDGYGDTFRYGCKVGGCTVHFVDYGEDTGPIIGQKAFAIEPGDTLESVKEKGLKLEWQLYPECIQYFSQGRLNVTEKTCPLNGRSSVKRKIVEIVL
jgi:phosphoribosylglycinamide formyltransferase-1